MPLDNASVDGLEVEHAGVARQIAANPSAAILFEFGPRSSFDDPVIEGSGAGAQSRRVAPPLRLSTDDREIATDMLSGQQAHPQMAGGTVPPIVALILERAASDSHGPQVVDWLAEYRIVARLNAVRCALDALRFRHEQFIADPAMARIPPIGIRVVGGNEHARRTVDMLEILPAPGVLLVNRHMELK